MYSNDFVVLALRLYNNREKYGNNINDLVDITKISRSTLYKWVNDYINNPTYAQFIYNDTTDMNSIPTRTIKTNRSTKKLRKNVLST